VFANAGILPETTSGKTQTAVSAKQTVTASSSCTIGTWCDSQTVRPTQPPAHSASLPTDTKACKTGEWC